MSRMSRKSDLGTGLGRFRSFFDSDETRFAAVCAAFRCLFFINWAKVFDFSI